MASINEKRINAQQAELLKNHDAATTTMNADGTQVLLQNTLSHECKHKHEHKSKSLYRKVHRSCNCSPEKKKQQHITNHSHKRHHNHHHNHNHKHHHAKENSNSPTRNHLDLGVLANRKLEILDFHDSWLQEMQIYRKYMQAQKKQQLLYPHNHMLTSQVDCQFVDGHKTKITRLAEISDTNKSKTNRRVYRSVDSKRKMIRTTLDNKKSVRAISESSKEDKYHRCNNKQLHLKRPRDHTPANINNNNNKTFGLSTRRLRKSSHNSKKVKNSLANSTNTNVNINANVNAHVNANAIPNANANATANANVKVNGNSAVNANVTFGTIDVRSTPTNHHISRNSHISHNYNQHYFYSDNNNSNNNDKRKANAHMNVHLGASHSPNKSRTKIIVNQFHASSLLNGHEFEEKAKILTQNGLTKSSAVTAYEASFYATNYLTPTAAASSNNNNNNNNNNNMTITRTNLGDYSNFVGVSLAKSHNNRNADDDPCTAIDDVTTYTDTDSDEEYIGEPFYLEEDKKQETLQSKNIHEQLSKECLNITNTEKTQSSEYYRPKQILSPSLFPNVPPYLNFSSHVDKGPEMPAQLHKVLKWKLSPVMPKIVKRVVLNSGFRIIKNTTDWMAIWEKHMKSPGFRTIRSHQKYNHMPGSFRIGRKDTMWRSIQSNMKKFGTKEFGFMQKSYVMPDDLESLRLAWPKNASRLTKWIVKPPASARGTGIRIINKWSQFPKDRPLVVQKYIERPLLVNDNKFDMRIYVVLTSVNPLRIYLYKDGLARFASVKYSSELDSLDERCMHLTNYSINKFSQNYSKNEDFNACQGHKWTLQSLWSCLESRGVNTKRLWATLRNLVIRALVSGESGLNRVYRQNVNFRYNCFELFGFDVLLDENLIPWLLEINISPSLHSELPLDLHVKGPLIQAVLNTALYQVPPKLSENVQNEILTELKLEGPLCHDKRIFTTCLTAEEVRKHNQFTNRSVEYREEYLDNILENLLPDDVRCLLVTEDELARCKPLERIFPTANTHTYLKFIENPRYYNRLLDAWENRYANCREKGIALLTKFCKEKYHLNVSDATLQKEPDVDVTEIDMLHVKKSDNDTVATSTSPVLTNKLSDSDIPSQPSICDIQKDKSAKDKQEYLNNEYTAQCQKPDQDNEFVNKDNATHK